MIKFYFFNFIYFLIQFSIFLIKIICLLIAIAYFTIAERKIMAVIQRRVGPNIEGGNFGLLQPLADGLKLIIKELIIPNNSNILLFFIAPSLVFILSNKYTINLRFYKY
jgi:NADH:ubiquinone oxidoreductase subunit H